MLKYHNKLKNIKIFVINQRIQVVINESLRENIYISDPQLLEEELNEIIENINFHKNLRWLSSI